MDLSRLCKTGERVWFNSSVHQNVRIGRALWRGVRHIRNRPPLPQVAGVSAYYICMYHLCGGVCARNFQWMVFSCDCIISPSLFSVCVCANGAECGAKLRSWVCMYKWLWCNRHTVFNDGVHFSSNRRNDFKPTHCIILYRYYYQSNIY